jgi:hypothetical protein
MDYLSTPTPLEASEENPPQELGQRLVHDYSTAIAEAELRWLDSKLSALSRTVGESQDRGLYSNS